jgi:hypothetical protein
VLAGVLAGMTGAVSLAFVASDAVTDVAVPLTDAPALLVAENAI